LTKSPQLHQQLVNSYFYKDLFLDFIYRRLKITRHLVAFPALPACAAGNQPQGASPHHHQTHTSTLLHPPAHSHTPTLPHTINPTAHRALHLPIRHSSLLKTHSPTPTTHNPLTPHLNPALYIAIYLIRSTPPSIYLIRSTSTQCHRCHLGVWMHDADLWLALAKDLPARWRLYGDWGP